MSSAARPSNFARMPERIKLVSGRAELPAGRWSLGDTLGNRSTQSVSTPSPPVAARTSPSGRLFFRKEIQPEAQRARVRECASSCTPRLPVGLVWDSEANVAEAEIPGKTGCPAAAWLTGAFFVISLNHYRV